jgi:hypothetical protein
MHASVERKAKEMYLWRKIYFNINNYIIYLYISVNNGLCVIQQLVHHYFWSYPNGFSLNPMSKKGKKEVSVKFKKMYLP